MNNNDIINALLSYESGTFVNNPLDHGGPTRWGITAQTLGNYRNLGRPATIAEVQDLTQGEASKIYQQEYIDKPKFNLIKNDMIRWFMVDSGVVHGPINPINWLQTILGVKKDGVFGPATNTVLETLDPCYLLIRLQGARGEAIARLVDRDITQRLFLVGWMTRLNSICTKAATILTPKVAPKEPGFFQPFFSKWFA